MNFFVSVVDVRGRIEWELWEVGTYNWRHMPHGDAGGVMSVATASALNVEWPPVCRKETC